MKANTLQRLASALALSAAAIPSFAEDIDIYSAPTAPSGAPNVLIVMDNTANWSQSFSSSTKFAAEKVALSTVINALTAQFNLGLALFSETGGGNSNTDGGYVRFAIQNMTNPDGTASAARACLLKMIGGAGACTLSNSAGYTDLDIISDRSNGGKGGVAMAEVYKYFAGATAYGGHNKLKTDYTRVFTNGTMAGPTYIAPPLNPCTKNYVIVINNGPFSDNNADTTQAFSMLSAEGGSTATINPPDNGTSSNNAADEWVRFMNTSAIGAITYTVEVGPNTTGQGPYNTRLLQSMGRQGKGGYFAASNAAQLVLALQRIVNDILATNSVFASASLPLSADNSGVSANQVYMGVFRPDAAAAPRWPGNLKQYKFKFDANDNALLVDQQDNLASSASGFAHPDSESFWTSKNVALAPDAPTQASTNATNGSTGGFWYFDSKGSGLSYDLPDGQYVEKGGAAQQLRLSYLGYGGRGGVGDTNASTLNSQPARKLFTCTGTCATNSALSGYPFEYNNAATSGAITTTAFGAADATALQTMIRWIRGQDTANENLFQVNGANTDVRASIHGDILHSRPVVLDYGTAGIYVFYGGNDGVFRGVKGGQTATDGKEQWGFIPTEFFGKFKRLYDNTPVVLYPSTNLTTNPTAIRRDYFFDGPVATHVERDVNNNISKAILYISMRRGGRLIYALDVTAPTNPKFLWKKSYTDTGFAELGQTWSQPTVTRVAASTDPVLIFGAGYDNVSEDTEPPSSTDSMGRAIYVLNALTGEPLWAAGKPGANFSSLPSGMSFTQVPAMDFSIAGEVLVVDRTNDGYADRIYATDVGGNVWRADIGSSTPSSWSVWKLASLADRSAVASTRKLLFGVDMVRGKTFDAVFVGSGDREHPLYSANTNTAHYVANRFYMIKDSTGATGADLGVFDHCGASITSSCSNLFDASSNGTVTAGSVGWAVNFPNPGQKVVNRPLALGGHILFGTNHPDLTNSQCSASLGIARRFDIAFDLEQTSITVASETAPGGGFLPNTTVVVVTAEKDNGDGTTSTVTRVVAADNPLSPGLHTPSITVDGKRYRSYWRQLME